MPSLPGETVSEHFFAPGPNFFTASLRSSSKATSMEQGHAQKFTPRCIDIPESNCYTPCFRSSVIRAICSCISRRVTPSGRSSTATCSHSSAMLSNVSWNVSNPSALFFLATLHAVLLSEDQSYHQVACDTTDMDARELRLLCSLVRLPIPNPQSLAVVSPVRSDTGEAP